MTPEQIISEAESSVNRIDAEIAELRAERKNIGGRIAELLIQRKPLARIAKAATPRRQNVSHE